LKKKIKELSLEMREIKKENSLFLKKIGLVRYNPFNERGGDQSFSLAILNKNDDGLVVTSIYSQEGSRVFSKSIIKGGSQYQLSKEEIEAIEISKNYD
jgi:hypothetical protein